MLVIKQLVEFMKDEICDVKEYSMLAIRYKASRPELASIYHSAAVQEMQHFKSMHTEVMKIVEEVKNSGKTIPSGMMEKFEREHECLVDKQVEVKAYLDLYSSQ